jgi:outer membrane protein TolC
MIRRQSYAAMSLIWLGLLSAFGFSQTLTLHGVIEEAMVHNPELLQKSREVRAAKASFWEGISPSQPELFMECENIPFSSSSLSRWEERKIGITQSFDFPLIYFFRGRWHHLNTDRVEEEFNRLQNYIVRKVKEQFFKILLLDRQLLLYRDIAGINRLNYAKAEIRVLSGESSSYDTLRVKVDLAEIENQILAVQKELDIARAELAITLGKESTEFFQVEGDLTVSPIQLDLDSLRTLALVNHPSVQITRAQMQINRTEQNLAWSALLPGISARYFQKEFRGDTMMKTWGGEIELSIPFWFFLKEQGHIRAASHRFEASRIELESVRRQICLDVDRSYSHLVVAEKQVQNYQDNTLREVEELVRITRRSYEEGEMGYLEVAEAMRALNRIKAGYYRALYEVHTARSALEETVGSVLFPGLE